MDDGYRIECPVFFPFDIYIYIFLYDMVANPPPTGVVFARAFESVFAHFMYVERCLRAISTMLVGV